MEIVLSEEPVGLHRLFKMNLFQISEVKKIKGGGLEIKLFDRQKAMEKLLEISRSKDSSDSADSFIKALENASSPVTEESDRLEI